MASYDKNQTDTNQENIWIFLDDSYIWIEDKKSAKLKSRYKLTTAEDHRICISVGGLIETVVRNNRNIKESILYGSEPPLIDSVWKRAEEYGFKVKCHHRNKAVKENIVDAKLVADLTEIATLYVGESTNGVIAIICGDADYSPAIEIALNYKWNVEVYSWSGASSNEIKKLVKTFCSQLKIFNLDNYLSRLTFTEKEINIKNSIRLQAEIKASGVVLHLKQEQQVHGESFKQMEKVIENFSQWPIQYFCPVNQHGERKNDVLVVYFRTEKGQQFDIKKFIKTFNKSFPSLAQPYLQYVEQQDYRVSKLITTYTMEKTLDEESNDAEEITGKVKEIITGSTKKFSYDNSSSEEVVDSDSSSSTEEFEVVESRKSVEEVTDEKRSNTIKDDKLFKQDKNTHVQQYQLYSEVCKEKFCCKKGKRCKYSHTPEEKEEFKQRRGRNIARKTILCRYYPKCKKRVEDCDYAHGEDDAICKACYDKGHLTVNCKAIYTSVDDLYEDST